MEGGERAEQDVVGEQPVSLQPAGSTGELTVGWSPTELKVGNGPFCPHLALNTWRGKVFPSCLASSRLGSRQASIAALPHPSSSQCHRELQMD